MRLKLLSIHDKKAVTAFLDIKKHELAAYAFENIYIWKALYDIYWVVLEDALCIFFKDSLGCFLYLPPLAKKLTPAVIKDAFAIMDSYTTHAHLSRIENIEQQDLVFFKKAGYQCAEKFPDYLCERKALSLLAGNAFKSKRAAVNHFRKNYSFEYIPYAARFKDECVSLYSRWMATYKASNQDPVYQGMLKDSLLSLKVLVEGYADLGAVGRLIRIDDELKACTFGFKISKETFCILFEVTDLSIKGISQYIFARFCQELESYTYINIMDDCGLENLKRVKLSYHPVKQAASFIATRK